MADKTIKGFSKLSKLGKIRWIVENFFKEPETVMKELKSYWLDNEKDQSVIDGFIENTISNFPLPLGVAPNFVINGKTYCVPMVIEESSVVAAVSSAAKYWMTRGGFTSSVIDVKKVGHIHFIYKGTDEELKRQWSQIKDRLIEEAEPLMQNMVLRGGGLLDIELKKKSEIREGLYQVFASFDTRDSMGANFINSILETWAAALKDMNGIKDDIEIIMSILSNYTPECLVEAMVSCPVEELIEQPGNYTSEDFARRFKTAVDIANNDIYRAVTHNKGIFNGIDAVVLATGNDFRAVEAAGHAYAARERSYRSLSRCEIQDGVFKFSVKLPLAIGTVGGLTKLHPMARRSLELLGHPSAEELMEVIAAVGLAQNFAAIRSLITTGIQYGHMKMHLQNILHHFNASEKEITDAVEFFTDKTVTFQGVREYLEKQRQIQSGNQSGSHRPVQF